jgi:transketolase
MSSHRLIPPLTPNEITLKTCRIRKEIETICIPNGAGHIAPSLSCVEILAALYYNVMRISADPVWEDRDRLVFSKAHGGYGLYAILSDLGYIPRKEWTGFYAGSSLSGCVERRPEYGIEASCGSLGHGLPQAVGIAYGARLQKKDFRVYCIVGDGEMQEGTNWEALQFAAKYGLDNLTVIIDNNGLQAMDFLKQVLSVGDAGKDLVRKCRAFGCRTVMTDGHDVRGLTGMFRRSGKGAPFVVVARTVKGYGLSCMEDVAKFHFRIPTKDELDQGRRYE